MAEARPAGGCVGLIGQWGDWSCVHTLAGMTTRELRHTISQVCGVPQAALSLTAPSDVVRDLFFLGEAIPSVLSIMHAALSGACLIFVDARDLGIPLRAVSLPPVLTSIESLVRIAGGSRPSDIPLRVRGAPQYDSEQDVFLPQHKALIQIKVDRHFRRSLSLYVWLSGAVAGATGSNQ